METLNTDIIYIRTYGGTLIPISKVSLVTVDPNNGKMVQEIPLTKCILDLMHYNMHSYEKTKETWTELDNYSIVQKV